MHQTLKTEVGIALRRTRAIRQCLQGFGEARGVLGLLEESGAVKAVFDVMHGRVPTGIVNREIVERPTWRAKLERYQAAFGG